MIRDLLFFKKEINMKTLYIWKKTNHDKIIQNT